MWGTLKRSFGVVFVGQFARLFRAFHDGHFFPIFLFPSVLLPQARVLWFSSAFVVTVLWQQAPACWRCLSIIQWHPYSSPSKLWRNNAIVKNVRLSWNKSIASSWWFPNSESPSGTPLGRRFKSWLGWQFCLDANLTQPPVVAGIQLMTLSQEQMVWESNKIKPYHSTNVSPLKYLTE